MHEEELNGLFSKALQEAPPAPEELRHNVMASIRELEYAPRKNKINIFKTASAVACVAVFAVVIIAVSPRFLGKNAASPMAYSSGDNKKAEVTIYDSMQGADTNGGGVNADTPDGAEMPVPPAAEDSLRIQYGLKLETADALAEPDSDTFLVTGKIPEELEGLDYTEESDESRIYENVPDEVISKMLQNNSNVIAEHIDGMGNVVKWIP